MLTEDVEFDWSRRMLDGEVVTGHEEVQRFLQGVREIFDEIHIPADELTDLGDGVVLLSARPVQGRASGLDVEAAPRTCGRCATGRSRASASTRRRRTRSRTPYS